jgi:acyl dehydratase
MKRNEAIQFGRYLEDFEPGDVYLHQPGKTITEGDNNLFCLLTMNHHPVHLDIEYAGKGHHGKILVVGTLVFSLVVGMTVRDVSGKAIANLAYHEVEHKAPVFIGDTIHAETNVLSVRLSRSKPDRGIVRVETRAYNQHGDLVLTFQRSVLIPKRQEEVA